MTSLPSSGVQIQINLIHKYTFIIFVDQFSRFVISFLFSLIIYKTLISYFLKEYEIAKTI